MSVQSAIHDEAERLRDKLSGGKLMGEPIDLDNIDHAIVAAYHAGFMDRHSSSRWPRTPTTQELIDDFAPIRDHLREETK